MAVSAAVLSNTLTDGNFQRQNLQLSGIQTYGVSNTLVFYGRRHTDTVWHVLPRGIHGMRLLWEQELMRCPKSDEEHTTYSIELSTPNTPTIVLM